MGKSGGKITEKGLKVRSTSDGLHLDGSILWFDSKANGDLSFVSSASSAERTKVPQVIATEETVKILEAEKKKINALVCQYNRPFSIGKLKMELLPSGGVLGGASLYVESDKRRILYAPYLQPQKNTTVRQMQLKKAQTLIVGAHHEDPHGQFPNRKKEKDRLLQTVKKHIEGGQYPIIMCPPLAIGQEITKLLTDHDIPVAVHEKIYKVNRIYESYSLNLGPYTLYSSRSRKNKVLIFPLPKKTRQFFRRPLPPGPIITINDSLQDREQQTDHAPVASFHMSASCDGKELKEVIAAVNPKEVYIFGPYARRYVEELKGACKNVQPLYSDDQPTLF